ncbi:MAG: hypothetical protein HOP33_10700 [Verrucomicrobia bacterium]|nr:hypothetical protein [Verrucomicrobiota bacterium]
MKTMLELLIRLHEMRCCCERVKRNPQLTNCEKSVACFHKQLVRECLPVTVLNHYDRMKKTERTLLTCPEIFAMAVLVATYRSLSPLQRRRLVRHFKTRPPTQSSDARQNGTGKNSRSTARRFKAVTGDVVGKQWR